MTDFDRDQAAQWFERCCHFAELIGRIDAYTDAALTPRSGITPSEALRHIRRYVDECKNATPGESGGEPS